MQPVSPEGTEKNQRNTTVLVSNSADDFVRNYFESKTYKFTQVKSEHPNLKKFEHLKRGEIIYYHDGNGKKYRNALITCTYIGEPKSICWIHMQKKSGLLYRYDIPRTRLSQWKESFRRFYDFTERFEN